MSAPIIFVPIHKTTTRSCSFSSRSTQSRGYLSCTGAFLRENQASPSCTNTCPCRALFAPRVQATGGFAGPGSLTGVPAGTIELTEEDLGSVTLSGAFVRDDGSALPGSTTVFFYVEIAGQPDDFVRGREALDPATGRFSSVVTDVPAGSSRLFLSFVVTDPAESLDAAESGADTVFALQTSNFVCPPQLTITLEWFDAVSDVDLHVTEPGGTEVFFVQVEGVSAENNACARLTGGRLRSAG